VSRELRVNRIACSGHGDCAELLPELVTADEWGYPIVGGPVPPRLERRARRAVAACPALALLLTASSEETQSQPRAESSVRHSRLAP
jgi:ferredoxin